LDTRRGLARRAARSPLAYPELYERVLWRRVIAYAIDVIIMAAIGVVVWIVFVLLGVLSFGLLMPLVAPALALVPVIYHGFLVGSPRSAPWRGCPRRPGGVSERGRWIPADSAQSGLA
jgi:uncharacterized RDD family membrane protein YckC